MPAEQGSTGRALETDPEFDDVKCPDCRTAHPLLVSLFGGSASEVLLQCSNCRTCFNWVKWRGQLPPMPARSATPDADLS